MESKQRALLAPLIYSDIFSYPLTIDEIISYSPYPKQIRKDEAKQLLATLFPHVQVSNGYYFLQGRKARVEARMQSRKIYQEKESVIWKTIHLVKRIPTVQYIGLSGSLAAGSAKGTDDIDLFIITKKRTLFVTRLLLIVLLEVMGSRRKRNRRVARNAVCLNMIIDETAMRFPETRHDLYTARELTQMIPLYEKQTMHTKLLAHNAWVYDFLPHAVSRVPWITHKKITTTERVIESLLMLPMVEQACAILQRSYMKQHQTTETVSSHFLAFHPNDHRQKTLARYARKMKQIEAVLRDTKRKKMMHLPHIDKEKNIFYTA